MNSELKPCPFCQDGGNPKHLKIIYHSCESNLIKCMKCEASTCGYDTEEEAIAAWNTRAERTCKMIPNGETDFAVTLACSVCGNVESVYAISADKFNYCPNCGAKVVE